MFKEIMYMSGGELLGFAAHGLHYKRRYPAGPQQIPDQIPSSTLSGAVGNDAGITPDDTDRTRINRASFNSAG